MFEALGPRRDSLRLEDETDRGKFALEGLPLRQPVNENGKDHRRKTPQKQRIQEGQVHQARILRIKGTLGKSQIPSTKFQISTDVQIKMTQTRTTPLDPTHQIPMLQGRPVVLTFRLLVFLVILWFLVLGIWCLKSKPYHRPIFVQCHAFRDRGLSLCLQLRYLTRARSSPTDVSKSE